MDDPVVVIALYRFVSISDVGALQQSLRGVMQSNDIRGTMILAPEGINGTVAGHRQAIDSLMAWLRGQPGLEGLLGKESIVDEMPFLRTKVKLKCEIVTMGVPGLPATTGTYVAPGDWNALISDPSVTLIDTRNEYEVGIGTFDGATNPHTTSFRAFPEYADNNLDPARNPRIAMFCTGGIRCEKSTAYLKSRGFEEVYHLQGGILKYLEEVPQDESLWQGECFVFDDRVTVDHDLNAGSYDQCHACRMPITDADKLHPRYAPGVSCHHCAIDTSRERKSRFRERQHQIALAAERGEAHIGAEAADAQSARRAAKRRPRLD